MQEEKSLAKCQDWRRESCLLVSLLLHQNQEKVGCAWLVVYKIASDEAGEAEPGKKQASHWVYSSPLFPKKMEAQSFNGLRTSGSVDKNSPGSCVIPAPPKKLFHGVRVGLWTEQRSLFGWICCWGNSKIQFETPV